MTSTSILPLATRTLQYRLDLELEVSVAAAEHTFASEDVKLRWMLDYLLNAAAWQLAVADERSAALTSRAARPAPPDLPHVPTGGAGATTEPRASRMQTPRDP